MKITEIKDNTDFSNDDEGQIFDPRELIRKDLNAISHQVYVAREQLSDVCNKHGIKVGSIGSNVGMDIQRDLDYSCFDTQGVNKRVIIFLNAAERDHSIPEALRKAIKRQTIKLTNLHTEQQKLFDKLRKLGDEAAGYNIDTGWSFNPVQQKWI